MRALILAALQALVPALLCAQDAREIVRRSVETDRRNADLVRNYTYLQRLETRELDAAGRVKRVESGTTDVTWQHGSPYHRLVARNDQPLSPKEEKTEEERLQKNIEERRKESPEQRARRAAEWQRRQEKQRESFQELPDAFEFKLVGEEALNGSETYVIDATPKPDYKPKNRAGAYFRKLKARFWIDKSEYHWVKVDVEIMDAITLGGVLLRIGKGGHLTFEQAHINNEVWLPKRISGKGQMRIALVKVLRGEVITTFSDHKKFQANSRLVSPSAQF